MKIAVAVLLLALAPTMSHAQKVFKCTSAAGAITYSHEPCGADAKEIDTARANRKQVPTDHSDASNTVALDDMDRACSHRLDALYANAAAELGPIKSHIASLRYDMNYSRNNLAGAQRDTGIQTEIAGLEIRQSTIEAARDSAVYAAKETCRLERVAEVKRQEDLASQRALK